MKTRVVLLFFASMIGLIITTPIALLIIQAFIPMNDAISISHMILPLRLFPNTLSVEQFTYLFSQYPTYVKVLCRDFAWSLLTSVIQVYISIVNGYILAKYTNRFCTFIVVLFMLTVITPLQIFLIPTYQIAQLSGLEDRSLLLYLPIAFSPLGTVFMRQTILKLPNENIEYLRIEGGSFMQLLNNVVTPFCHTSALVLFLLTFVECWSMIEQPLILLTNKAHYPLSMLLYDMRSSKPQIIFAGSIAALSPIAVFAITAGIMWAAEGIKTASFK